MTEVAHVHSDISVTGPARPRAGLSARSLSAVGYPPLNDRGHQHALRGSGSAGRGPDDWGRRRARYPYALPDYKGALREWLPVLPAISCSALLGVLQLGQPSLWIDEAFTAQAMGYDLPRLTEELQWLYYTAMRPWAALVGTSEFALRFPSVIGAILAVALLYGLARKMLGERVAFIAALLLALNSFFVQWSQQARSYTFLVALAVGTTWLLLRALETDDGVAWVVYGVAATAMIVVQFYSAFLLLPAHVLVAWRSRRARVTWALILLASFPWIERTLARGEEGAPTTWLRRPGFQDVWDVTTSVPGALGIALVLAVVGLTRVRGCSRLLLGAWAFLPFALSLTGSVWKPMFLDRYLIISAPAFAILAAVALIELPARLRVAAVGAVAAAMAIGLIMWYAPDDGDNWKGENWRAATALVMRYGGATVEPDWAMPAFRYYGGREAANGWLLERAEYPSDLAFSHDVRQWYGERLRAVQGR